MHEHIEAHRADQVNTQAHHAQPRNQSTPHAPTHCPQQYTRASAPRNSVGQDLRYTVEKPHLVHRKLGAGGNLFERDIPVLAVSLENHVHQTQQSNFFLGESRPAHQRRLRRHCLQRAVRVTPFTEGIHVAHFHQTGTKRERMGD